LPPLTKRTFHVLFDVAGCPNRCRHCWLGKLPNGRISEGTMRSVTRQFREWRRSGGSVPFAERVNILSWWREPDFAEDYRRLWELERELSDDAPPRFELLSIWRLARDRDYAGWAREVGTEGCQISFFGLEETTDWFVRRRGAFRDSLLATERLIEAGIRPRWQVFLTTKLPPELDAFLNFIRDLRLEERVRERFGVPFPIFLNVAGPDGEAARIERLRPAAGALERLPGYLVEKTLAHFGVGSLAECLGQAESALLPDLLVRQEPHARFQGTLSFFITPALDVYANVQEPASWSCLGNLEREGLDRVLARFECDETPGLHGLYHVPVAELACRYGRPDCRQLYSPGDLVSRWIRLRAQEEQRARGVGPFVRNAWPPPPRERALPPATQSALSGRRRCRC